MKSIKQQYIDLTEGRMSQFNFMRNLRMTMPQYVTNVTSFKDAVRILKNKGILTEAKTKLTADQVNNDELRMGIKVEMEHTDDPEKAKKIALDHLAENPFYYTQLKLSGVDTKALPSKEYKAIAKKKDETEFVDKANQMKPVKGVEKIKASANKAKKETNQPVKGVSSMSLVSKTVRGVKKMDPTGEKVKKIKEGYDEYVSDRDYDNLDAEYEILTQIAMDAPNYDSAVVALEDYGVDTQLANSIAARIHPEDDDTWIDPAGGTHYGNESDPAAMYAENLYSGEEWSLQPEGRFWILTYRTIEGNKEKVFQSEDEAKKFISTLNKKVDVPGEIFRRNARLTTNLTRLGRGEDPLLERIREAIRKMIKQEMFDGRDNMTDIAGHQLDENQNNKYILIDEDGLPYLNSEVVAQYLKSVIDPEEIESVDVFMNDHEGWGESSMYFFDVPDETPEATEEEVEKFAKQEMSYWLTSKPDEFPHKY